MNFDTLIVPGADAIHKLVELRARYLTSGQYPFLIGDRDEMDRIVEIARFNQSDPAEIVRASMGVTISDWIARREQEVSEYGCSRDDFLGVWPGEIHEKGSIGLHRDVLSGKIKPEVYIGLAKIESPWQLPSAVNCGGWNECPDPEVHCAFHRDWQARFGSEITGFSGEVIECAVKTPPSDQDAAMTLAIEQYWYCADIVEQGCGSIASLAATLLRSPYWYFWWD